jgi:hypothetical protein
VTSKCGDFFPTVSTVDTSWPSCSSVHFWHL